MFIRAGAAVRWRNIESSMSHGKALPLPLTVPILGQGDAVAAAVVAMPSRMARGGRYRWFDVPCVPGNSSMGETSQCRLPCI